jgi:HD-GYP domain-containing protein (c-di-GMP phosphodiesterase class II)
MSWDRPSAGRSATPERVDALASVLLDALEQHLPGTRAHGEATGTYAFAAAAQLGMDRDRAELVRQTAKLHDVGMVYVPSAVLRKPQAELTDEERQMLASHIEAGSLLALGAGIPSEICEWILHTRERWDGAGPSGLAQEAIPIESRIVRVGCAADLMLAGAEREATVAGLRAAAGSELDPLAVSAIVKVLNRVAQPQG